MFSNDDEGEAHCELVTRYGKSYLATGDEVISVWSLTVGS